MTNCKKRKNEYDNLKLSVINGKRGRSAMAEFLQFVFGMLIVFSVGVWVGASLGR